MQKIVSEVVEETSDEKVQLFPVEVTNNAWLPHWFLKG